jgi:hypothetical protein
MDARWIIVRDHQARLRAEAAEERLARRARSARAEQRAADPSATLLAEGQDRASRRLAMAGATLAADRQLTTGDCQEA